MKPFYIIGALLLLVIHASNAFAQTNYDFQTVGFQDMTKQLFLVAVHLSVSSSKSGVSGTGTGFVVSTGGESNELYLVTNRHMIEGFDTGTITFIPGATTNPVLGQIISAVFTDWATRWGFHPDSRIDVAVTPFSRRLAMVLSTNNLPRGADGTLQIAILTIPPEAFLGLDKTNVPLDSEEVEFVGFPADVYDKLHYLPIIRHGYTASPIALDFDQPKTFAIDAPVFPGSSGSPVFILTHATGFNQKGGIETGTIMRFAGIVADYAHVDSHGSFIIKQVPADWSGTFSTSQALNLGIVFRAETITETIDAYLKAHPKGESN